MSQKPNAEWLPLIYSTLLLVLFFSFSKLAKDGWHTLTIHVKKDFLLFLSLDFLLVSLPLENKNNIFFFICVLALIFSKPPIISHQTAARLLTS